MEQFIECKLLIQLLHLEVALDLTSLVQLLILQLEMDMEWHLELVFLLKIWSLYSFIQQVFMALDA